MLQQRLNCFDKRKIVRRVAHNEDDDDDEDAVHERDDFDVDDVSGCDSSKQKIPVIWRNENRIIKRGSFCPALDQVRIVSSVIRFGAILPLWLHFGHFFECLFSI